MSLGESLDMTYSNMSFEHVIKAFGANGEDYLEELELGKFADNAGELLIVPNVDAPLMYVNVQALEQILGLNGASCIIQI